MLALGSPMSPGAPKPYRRVGRTDNPSPEGLLKPSDGLTFLGPVSFVLALTISARRSVHLGCPRAVRRSLCIPFKDTLNALQTNPITVASPSLPTDPRGA